MCFNMFRVLETVRGFSFGTTGCGTLLLLCTGISILANVSTC